MDITEKIKDICDRSTAEAAAKAGISIEEQERRDREEMDLVRDQAGAKVSEERQKRHEARSALGTQLGIGAACHIGHLVMCSGLTDRSNMSGMTRATVWHVVIDEPTQIGRHSREPGDLLCRREVTFNDRAMGVTGRDDWDDCKDPDPEVRPVTCKTCLRKLARLK